MTSFGEVIAQNFTPPDRLTINGKSGVFFDSDSEYWLIAGELTRQQLIEENYGLRRAVKELIAKDSINSNAFKLYEKEIAILESDVRREVNARNHFKQEAESNLKAFDRADKARKRNRRWYLVSGVAVGIAGTIWGGNQLERAGIIP